MLPTTAVPFAPMTRCLRARSLALFGSAAVAMAAAVAPAAAQQPVPPPPRLVQPDGTAPAATTSQPARRGVSAAAAASAASAVAASTADARPHIKVIEDDNVRIEEARVRGQVQRITVQNKTGGRTGGTSDYEIIVTPGGKDTSQDRGAMGQRAWSLFAF